MLFYARKDVFTAAAGQVPVLPDVSSACTLQLYLTQTKRQAEREREREVEGERSRERERG